MEETNFILLWKEYYQKIDESLALNKQLVKESITQKTQSVLQSLANFKVRGIIAAVIYLLIMGSVLFYTIAHYSSATNYFIISIGAIFIINIKALYDYIKHLMWINKIDYNGSVTAIQERLIELQFSILKHVRIVILQLPFWTTFQLSSKWFPQDAAPAYIVFQILLTGIFTYVAIWLYKNLTMKNKNKKWFKVLINGSGGKYILKALEFSKELQKFKEVEK